MNKSEKLIKKMDEIGDYDVIQKVNRIIERNFNNTLKELNILYKSMPPQIQNNWIYIPGSSTSDIVGEGIRKLADSFKPGWNKQDLLTRIRSFLLEH